jgi:hypothetical protein
MSDEQQEKFCGVNVLLERMKTHPEEFFESGNEAINKRGRWAFMYKDYFRDSMTEAEKGRLHEALKQVRRMEFDALVVKELMKEAQETKEMVEGAGLAFPETMVKTSGQKVRY